MIYKKKKVKPEFEKPETFLNEKDLEIYYGLGDNGGRAFLTYKWNKTQKVGRPTGFQPEYIDMAWEYINKIVSRNEEEEIIDTRVVEEFGDLQKEKKTYKKKVNTTFPTIEGLALYIGVNNKTILDWAKVYPEFSGAIDTLMKKQKKQLIDGVNSGIYHAGIANLILSHNFGMAIKTENLNKNIDEDIDKLSDEELEKQIQESERKLNQH